MIDIFKKLSILPRWIIIIIDVMIIFSCVILGYLIRFNFDIDQLADFYFLQGAVIYTILGFLSILVTHSYAGIVRFTGIQDGIRILQASFLNLALGITITWVLKSWIGSNIIPLSVLITSFLASFIFLFFYRLLVKSIFSYYLAGNNRTRNVLIFGTGQAGLVTKQVLESSEYSEFKVVGFIDDKSKKSGKFISGKRIYNSNGHLERTFKNLAVSELIITDNDISIRKKNELVDLCLKNNVKIRTVPPIDRWVKGELSVRQIRQLKIEDLLGREEIKLESMEVERQLNAKTVLVSGAAGSIGSELVRQISLYSPARVILVDQSESQLYHIEQELSLHADRVPELEYILADITNENRLRQIFDHYRPKVLYHAAAYKHVPLMEDNPFEAVWTNIKGTKTLADLAVEFEVESFVMVSTDKAVNPTNVMGCTKRLCEIYVQSLNNTKEVRNKVKTKFITTRFGNVLGSSGSVIPLFKKQIENGGPITVTHPDVKRYFMTIPEACHLVLEAGAMGKGGEIFIFDMGESVRIIDLAHRMIQLSGLEVGKDIEIEFIGLRSGEKLYEELLATDENTIPTHHEKIMIAKVPEMNYSEIDRGVCDLIQLSKGNDDYELVSLMKTLVPEYKSHNSRYEKLDVPRPTLKVV